MANTRTSSLGLRGRILSLDFPNPLYVQDRFAQVFLERTGFSVIASRV